MKAITLAVTVAGMILIPIALYILSQRGPDVRYTLSQPIRTSQAGGLQQTWQQIRVLNRGKGEAVNLQLKIAQPVSHYELLKHSEADAPQFFSSPETFELVYPSLPPQGTFTLTMATPKEEVQPNGVSLAHKAGVGAEAFSAQDKFRTGVIILWIAIVSLCFVVPLLGVRMAAIEQADSQSRWRPEWFLTRKRPFYFSERKWLAFRQQAMQSMVGDPAWYTDLSGSKAYQILSSVIPKYLTQKEWDELRSLATMCFEKSYDGHASSAYYRSDIVHLLRVERPSHLPDATWLKLRERAEHKFLEIGARELYFMSASKELRELSELLRDGQVPPGVPEETWKVHLRNAEDQYERALRWNLETSSDPFGLLQTHSPLPVSPEIAQRLHETSYRRALALLPDVRSIEHAEAFLKVSKPDWMTDEDYRNQVERANKTIEFQKDRTEFNRKSALMKKRASRLAAKEKELADKLTKITRQLDTIDQLFHDPSVIDRVEEYNNPFAPGNFANLRRLSSFLKAAAPKGGGSA